MKKINKESIRERIVHHEKLIETYRSTPWNELEASQNIIDELELEIEEMFSLLNNESDESTD